MPETPCTRPLDDARLQAIELAAEPLNRNGALWSGATDDPAFRRYVEGLPPDTVLDLVREVRALRVAVRSAVRLLERIGVTPDAIAREAETGPGAEMWDDALQVWRAAGVPCPTIPAYRLRFSRTATGDQRAYPTARAALEAAIEALEMNEAYPEAIEADGIIVMDSAEILRAWEERHVPG